MTLSRYLIFKTVTETMSFTKAADQLNLTQSAVSHGINTFEKELGFAVFKRVNNSIKLTNEGLLLINEVNKLLVQEKQIQNLIDSINKLEVASLKIGSFLSASSRYLPQIIKMFDEKYPNIKLDIYEGNYSDIKAWLDEGKIDIAFLAKSYINKSHDHEFLFRDEMLFLVPEETQHDFKDKIDIKDIERYPFIMPNNSSNRFLEEIFNKYKVTPNIKYNIELPSTVMAMVEKDLGISIVAESTVLHSRFKVKIKSFHEPIYREIYIATNTTGMKSKAVKEFFRIAKCVV